ncbi:MAG TPA: hypothetical protein VFI96_01605, partial [Longimicrobiaceae bacterium]|nr:hypothetical protein [Longimicrobiaceae bacterium]
NPEELGKLPEALRAIYVQAFTSSLSTVFFVAAGVSVLGFLLTWLVPEQPLRETIAAAAGNVGHDAGETFPLPTDREAAEEFLRGLAALADRDVQRAYIEQVVAHAGLELSPAEAYLLVRYDLDPCTDLVRLARSRRLDRDRLEAALTTLQEKGLVRQANDGGKRPAHHPTHAGCDVLDRLAEARRERLEEVMGEWTPERREELSAVLHGLAHELVPEATRPEG